MRSYGVRRRGACVAVKHGVVVLAMAAALLGQMSRAHAGGFPGDRLDPSVVAIPGDTNMSLNACHPERGPVYCGMTARPVPPLVPGEPPAVTEDTGVGPVAGESTGGVGQLWDLCGACGAGAGMASLACFWLLCVPGLWAMPRGRRR
jgi:hypothetical protein